MVILTQILRIDLFTTQNGIKPTLQITVSQKVIYQDLERDVIKMQAKIFRINGTSP